MDEECMIISPPKRRKQDSKEKQKKRISNEEVVILSVNRVEPAVQVLGSRTIRKPRIPVQISSDVTVTNYSTISSMPSSSLSSSGTKAIRTKTPEPAEPLEPAMIKCTVCLELASEKTSLCATKCGHVLFR
jgi:hypothetical protein